jgi:hypothetical protein
LGASVLLFGVGTTVAIVQPGDLGDEDVASDTTTSTSSTTTTTIADTTSTTSSAVATTVPGSTTTAPTGVTSTTIAGTSTTLAATTSTTVGSGLGAEGSGNVNPDGSVADTGMESQLPLGLGLVGLALAARRLLRPRTA